MGRILNFSGDVVFMAGVLADFAEGDVKSAHSRVRISYDVRVERYIASYIANELIYFTSGKWFPYVLPCRTN